MLFDLHIHSEYSYDSTSKIDDILKISKKIGLAGIAITDHEEFSGSLQACAKAKDWDLLVIPGMEIATEYGDIIGLFLQEKITSKAFSDVIGEIKNQNGLVLLPHPYKRTNDIPDVVTNNIDLIEVFNARGESIGNNSCNHRAYNLALQINIPMTAGSDAHFLFEIGRGCISIDNPTSIENVREKLLRSTHKKIIGRPSSLQLEVLSQIIKGYKNRDINTFKSSLQRFAKILKWKIYNKYSHSKGRNIS